MLRDFSNENFERFLKQSADQLRMRPSENVWHKIEKRMQRRRRRVIFTSALFLLTASVFGYYLIESSQTLHDSLPVVNTLQKPSDRSLMTQKPTVSTSESLDITQTRKSRPESNNQLAATDNRLPAAGNEPQLIETVPDNTTATALFTPTIVDAYEPLATDNNFASTETIAASDKKENLLTIESVVNAYKPGIRKKKVEFQFFFTPTVSYRKLSENKSYLRSVPSNSITFNNAFRYNVNSVVTHKPALGLEVGFALKYGLTNSIKLRSGLQFNMTRYDIKAFNYIPEVATIALNRGAAGIDSLNTITRYRNSNTSPYADWLENMYLQISAPVGVEIKLLGNKNTHFGIATTVQPTYVLTERAYLISTDYKNYTTAPSLARRWNVNTSLETYVGYATGKLKWQIGPQVRYQLLSSFDTKYPVKENLFDFGLKVGVSLNK
jgi:hypothetical protein